MATRRLNEPVTKVTLNVYAVDYERLRELYPVAGPTRAIRELIRNHIAKVEAKAARLSEPSLIDEIEIDLPEETQ